MLLRKKKKKKKVLQYQLKILNVKIHPTLFLACSVSLKLCFWEEWILIFLYCWCFAYIVNYVRMEMYALI